MHNQKAATPAICAYADNSTELAEVRSIAVLTSPTLPQIQTAAEWLTTQPYPNLDLEIALNLVLQGRIILQESGERVAISVEPQCTRPLRINLREFKLICGG